MVAVEAKKPVFFFLFKGWDGCQASGCGWLPQHSALAGVAALPSLPVAISKRRPDPLLRIIIEALAKLFPNLAHGHWHLCQVGNGVLKHIIAVPVQLGLFPFA